MYSLISSNNKISPNNLILCACNLVYVLLLLAKVDVFISMPCNCSVLSLYFVAWKIILTYGFLYIKSKLLQFFSMSQV